VRAATYASSFCMTAGGIVIGILYAAHIIPERYLVYPFLALIVISGSILARSLRRLQKGDAEPISTINPDPAHGWSWRKRLWAFGALLVLGLVWLQVLPLSLKFVFTLASVTFAVWKVRYVWRLPLNPWSKARMK